MEIILLTICIGFIGAVFIGSALAKQLVISIVSGLGFFLLLIALFAQIYFSMQDATRAQIEQGRYYTTECQLIETNIDNGLFQSNTNKLKCDGAVENVPVDEYQEAIEAYKKSQANR